jgi:hypothetical protein
MPPKPRCRTQHSTTQLVLGLIVITVGVLTTLDNLGVLDAQYYFRFWPVAIIAIGLAKLWRALDGQGGYVTALAFSTAGTWLLLEQLDLLTISFREVWPALLVLVGGSLVWQALSRSRPAAPDEPDELGGLGELGELGGLGELGEPGEPGRAQLSELPGESRHPRAADDANAVLHATAILGSVVRGNNSPRFRGGSLTVVMGGCEIDLRNASIEREAVIEVFAMWGGIEIRVPEDWTVVSQVNPVLGGVADTTRPPQTAGRRRLVLRGFVIMAGIEVKN